MEYQKKYREANKQQISEKYWEKRKVVYDHLRNNPCEICGESRIEALQFDHIDRDKKRFSLANTGNRSMKSILEEIKKCRVLCANCHMVHTAKQLNWYTSKYI